MWPSAHQRVPRALQGRVRVPRALHGHEGRPTRLAPAPRALGARAMSDDEQTQLEAHDVLLYHDFANLHEVMEAELTASDLIEQGARGQRMGCHVSQLVPCDLKS